MSESKQVVIRSFFGPIVNPELHTCNQNTAQITCNGIVPPINNVRQIITSSDRCRSALARSLVYFVIKIPVF